jgi:hypothetical protein
MPGIAIKNWLVKELASGLLAPGNIDADPGPAWTSAGLGLGSDLDALTPPFYRKAIGIKSDVAAADGFYGATLHSH